MRPQLFAGWAADDAPLRVACDEVGAPVAHVVNLSLRDVCAELAAVPEQFARLAAVGGGAYLRYLLATVKVYASLVCDGHAPEPAALGGVCIYVARSDCAAVTTVPLVSTVPRFADLMKRQR